MGCWNSVWTMLLRWFGGVKASAVAVAGRHGWRDVCREQVDLSRPEHQLNYTHEVRVHDVGTYQFKGITADFSIKSINLAAFEGRNVGYVGGMKSGKAKQVAQGRGYERVRLCNARQLSDTTHCDSMKGSCDMQSALISLPTPAVLLERLHWQSELQEDKPASSSHCDTMEQWIVDGCGASCQGVSSR